MTAQQLVGLLIALLDVVVHHVARHADPDVREATLELTLKWRRDLDGFIEAVADGNADRVADYLADLERRRVQSAGAGSGDEDGGEAAGGG